MEFHGRGVMPSDLEAVQNAIDGAIGTMRLAIKGLGDDDLTSALEGAVRLALQASWDLGEIENELTRLGKLTTHADMEAMFTRQREEAARSTVANMVRRRRPARKAVRS